MLFFFYCINNKYQGVKIPKTRMMAKIYSIISDSYVATIQIKRVFADRSIKTRFCPEAILVPPTSPNWAKNTQAIFFGHGHGMAPFLLPRVGKSPGHCLPVPKNGFA
jgi:hypothetical protein